MKSQIKFKNKEDAQSFIDYCKVEGATIEEKENDVLVAYEVECKSCEEENEREMYCQMYREFDRRMEYVWARMDRMEQRIWKHESEGHIPPIKSAEQLQRALAALGLDSEYDVQKRTIYASYGDHTLEAYIEK